MESLPLMVLNVLVLMFIGTSLLFAKGTVKSIHPNTSLSPSLIVDVVVSQAPRYRI